MPTMYEDQILFGATGFSLIINTIQTFGLTFVFWSLLLFVKHYTVILALYGNITYAFIIPGLVLYTMVYSYLLSISLRWFTILSSVNNI